MEQRLLTIIIPAYNVEKYVGQCLESLVKQTCRDFCAVIVDDGSKDANTSRICQEYAKKYPEWMEYIRQENKGLSGARNTGLRRVQTPYVAFLDSDDWLCIRFVERVKEELTKYNDDCIDLVFTLPRVYDCANGQMQDWMDKETFEEVFPENARVVDMGDRTEIFYLEPNACRRVYRTDFLRRCHFEFQEGTRWEDVYPHFYLQTQARKCLGIEDVGFNYRTNVPTSITASGGKSRLEIVNVFRQSMDYLCGGGFSAEVLASCVKMYTAFAVWSTEVAQEGVRREMIAQMHELYRRIPEAAMRSYLRNKKRSTYEERQFAKTMRSNMLYKMHFDYQTETMMNRALNLFHWTGGRKNGN